MGRNSRWLMKTVFLTGTNGFLGAKVKLRFEEEGFEVIALSNPTKFTCISNWLNYVEKEFLLKKPTVILNIGSNQSGQDDPEHVLELINSNIVVPTYFASLIKKYQPECQLITIGTSWQFGANGEYRPFNLYAATKQASDDCLIHYGLDQIKITSLVLFDTYSNDDKRRKLHNLIASAIKNNEALDMTAGEQVINLVHIDDVVDAVYCSFRHRMDSIETGFKQWAIKSDANLLVKDLVPIMLGNNQHNNLLNLGARAYRIREIFQIYDNFEIVPGWSPVRDLKNELRKLVTL
jgi:nucleoside-diphosphate-sugar epimerase